ncbi:extracellular solute-binding protein [Neorhizobium sp. JUb45]|uniref:extracellular solute-binding protein n=1 Tax=unclassified Neorhizobium TaxID=2629175 RepID=UPI00104AE65F|nr:extracellular solute-binding protein [Neorhizobium sp. JUb45]TCR03199.1 putative spermidine/putrescine transport system substrate-binding protein [Neorhizobium sp. JUb45]
MKRISTRVLSATLFAATMLSGAYANAADITVMGYRGPFEENYTKAVIQPFMKAHPDIKVTYYGVQNAANSLGNMRAQRDAPQVNAVIYDLSVAKIAKEEGLVADLDTSKLSNYADVSEIGKDLGGAAIPLTYDTLSLIYNAKAFPTAPTSWEALWDKKQDGKVVLPAQGGGDIQAILLTIIANRMAGENDYKKTIDPGVEKLVEVAPRVQTWEPKPDAYTLVANGTATVSIGWNARSQFYFDQTEGRMSSVGPTEGTASQINVISAIEKASEAEATQTFINYAISPEAQAAFAKAMFYAPVNTKAVVDEATAKRIPMMDPVQREKLIPVDWMTIGAMREDILQPWRRKIIPAGR